MIEPTDENTGLPPLQPPNDADTIWAVLIAAGQGDVLAPVTGRPEGVMVLSVRGLVNTPDGTAEWGQIHIAVPHNLVPTLAGMAAGYIAEFGGS